MSAILGTVKLKKKSSWKKYALPTWCALRMYSMKSAAFVPPPWTLEEKKPSTMELIWEKNSQYVKNNRPISWFLQLNRAYYSSYILSVLDTGKAKSGLRTYNMKFTEWRITWGYYEESLIRVVREKSREWYSFFKHNTLLQGGQGRSWNFREHCDEFCYVYIKYEYDYKILRLSAAWHDERD